MFSFAGHDFRELTIPITSTMPAHETSAMVGGERTSACDRYLDLIGVRPTPRATCPFDPGYDPVTVEAHLRQSGHLMGTLKISMACWMVAEEGAMVDMISGGRLILGIGAGYAPEEFAAFGYSLKERGSIRQSRCVGR